jgi:diacylglycerol kinase family enzyme
MGEWYYTAITLRTFHRRYIVHPPRLDAQSDGLQVSGVSAFVQNGPAYTYFGDRAIVICEEATLDSGRLCAAVLKRANPMDLPTVAWRALSRRARLDRHRQMDVVPSLKTLRVRSAGERPLPLQVDGDYIGDVEEVEFGVIPRGLTLIA